MMFLPFILIAVLVVQYLGNFMVVEFIIGTVVCKTIMNHIYPMVQACLAERQVEFPEDHLETKRRIV